MTSTATDASANVATATFVVHVRSAAEQLDRLAAAVKGIGPGTSLADKIAQARAAVRAGDGATATSILRALYREVAAQSGKKIAPYTAAALTEAATRIVAVIGSHEIDSARVGCGFSLGLAPPPALAAEEGGRLYPRRWF